MQCMWNVQVLLSHTNTPVFLWRSYAKCVMAGSSGSMMQYFTGYRGDVKVCKAEKAFIQWSGKWQQKKIHLLQACLVMTGIIQMRRTWSQRYRHYSVIINTFQLFVCCIKHLFFLLICQCKHAEPMAFLCYSSAHWLSLCLRLNIAYVTAPRFTTCSLYCDLNLNSNDYVNRINCVGWIRAYVLRDKPLIIYYQ